MRGKAMEETKNATHQTATTYRQLLFLVLKGKVKGLLELGIRLQDGSIAMLCRESFLSHHEVVNQNYLNNSGLAKEVKLACDKLNINSFEEGIKYVLKAINETDIHNQQCFEALSLACYVLGLKCFPEPHKEGLSKFFLCEEILRCKASEAIGYWTAKLERQIAYANNQGANSRELGDMSIKEAKKILEKIGGITGYDALGYGKKKPITDEIEKKLKLKDKRHVYNILNKIKADFQDD